MSSLRKINLAERFASFQAHWSPKIVAELNGQHVKLVRFAGEFVWHQHEEEDELFLVVKGQFRMEYRDPEGRAETMHLSEGEMVVVPRGVEHRPCAENEVWVLLFEPASTLNTGNAEDQRRVEEPERI